VFGEEWLWLAKLAKKVRLFCVIDHEEYLDLKAVVEYYLALYKNHTSNKNLWNEDSEYFERWYDFDAKKHIKLPEIIHKYFPGGSFMYEEGKGIVWEEKDEQYAAKQISILTDVNSKKDNNPVNIEPPKPQPPKPRGIPYIKPNVPKPQPPKQQLPKPQSLKPQPPKLTEEEMQEIENRRIKEEEQRKQRDAAIQRIFDDLAKGIF
jgi:hypothetical protein